MPNKSAHVENVCVYIHTVYVINKIIQTILHISMTETAKTMACVWLCNVLKVQHVKFSHLQDSYSKQTVDSISPG